MIHSKQPSMSKNKVDKSGENQNSKVVDHETKTMSYIFCTLIELINYLINISFK